MAAKFNISVSLPSCKVIYSIEILVDDILKRYVISYDSINKYASSYTIFETISTAMNICSNAIIASEQVCYFECSTHIGGKKSLCIQPPDLTIRHIGLPLYNSDILKTKLFDFMMYDLKKWIGLQNEVVVGDPFDKAEDEDEDEDIKWTQLFNTRSASFEERVFHYSSDW